MPLNVGEGMENGTPVKENDHQMTLKGWKMAILKSGKGFGGKVT